jgi:hypothetical protein
LVKQQVLGSNPSVGSTPLVRVPRSGVRVGRDRTVVRMSGRPIAQLANEARRIEEDTQHSGAQHFAAGQRWRGRACWLELPTTILVAAASTGAGLSALVGNDTRVTALLAFAVALVVAARDFIAADAKATAHSAKGARNFAVRDDARVESPRTWGGRGPRGTSALQSPGPVAL